MIRMLSLEEAIDLLGSPKWTEDFGAYCEELKKNFRKLIVKFHADKSLDEAMKKLGNKIIEAYSVIKDSIEKGDLKTYLYGKIKSKKVEETAYSVSQWEEGLYEDMSSITNIFVKKLGSMKNFLMSLGEGTRTVCYNGFKFTVTTQKTGRCIRGEPETIWRLKGDIESVKELGADVNPLQLIFNG